jgi:hypothetical protein
MRHEIIGASFEVPVARTSMSESRPDAGILRGPKDARAHFDGPNPKAQATRKRT